MRKLQGTVFFRAFPLVYIYILVPYLVLVYWLEKVWPYAEVEEMLKGPNTVCFSFLLAFYGLGRIPKFHPFFNKAYQIQLTLSPWECSKPLPYGPVHFCWIDCIVLLFFSIVQLCFPVTNWSIPFIAFLAGYNAGMGLLHPLYKQRDNFLIYALFLPLIVYPHRNLYAALGVLAVIFLFGQWKMILYLREFPWNTKWWTGQPADFFRQEGLRRRIIRWPFNVLSNIKTKSIRLPESILLASAVFWWVHVVSWFFMQIDKEVIPKSIEPFYLIPFIGIPALRFLVYLGYNPPISLIGRFATGHLIIPGYDTKYAAPIILALISIFVPGLLTDWGLPQLIANEITLGLLVFLALQLPPSLEKWHYTGQFHAPMPRLQNHLNFNKTLASK